MIQHLFVFTSLHFTHKVLIHLFIFVQVVSGGVASNQYVRARLNQVVNKNGLQLLCPPPSLCTDNGEYISL